MVTISLPCVQAPMGQEALLNGKFKQDDLLATMDKCQRNGQRTREKLGWPGYGWDPPLVALSGGKAA